MVLESKAVWSHSRSGAGSVLISQESIEVMSLKSKKVRGLCRSGANKSLNTIEVRIQIHRLGVNRSYSYESKGLMAK